LYYGLFFLLSEQHEFLAFSTIIFVSSLFALSVPRIPLRFKVGWVLFILYLTGSFLLFKGPHTNIGMLFLFASSIMAVTMSGAVAGLWYTLLHAITLTSVGLYWFSGWVDHADPADIALSTYINVSISFM